MCFACRPLTLRRDDAQPDRRRFLTQAASATALYATARVLRPSPAQAADGKADFIIENAKILTLDRKQPEAEAIAVAGSRIISVGKRVDVEEYRSPSTQVIDAGGRTVIPGLNDSHAHFIRGGLTYSQELRWDGVPSLSIALALLREQALRTPAPHWVQVVGGWTGWQFAEKRLPTLDEINAATGDVPCFIMHLYDRAFLNKAAMRVLGYGKDMPEPAGGLIERDAQGMPTGVVVNMRNIGSLLGIFARIPKLPDEAQMVSTKLFMRELNRLGVTSVIDAGGGGQNYPDNYRAIAKLAADKQLTLRISYSLFAQHPGKEIEDYRAWTSQAKVGEGDDFLRLMGAGEYLVWDAADQANFAKDIVIPPADTAARLAEAIKLVASKGWPFRLHADYDVTASRLLDAIEMAHREVPVDKLRWAIDHAETISGASLERVAKLGGSIALQNRMSLDGDAFAEKWGRDVAADAPPIGSIREMGLHFAAGTDGNRATSHNPWVGIQWLVTGKTIGGTKLNADRNLLDRTEALRAYTASGAWLSGEEDRKGTLEEGNWADLAILSDDYMRVPAEKIGGLTSVMTMVDGRVVHAGAPYAAMAPAPLPVAPDWLPVAKYPGYHQAALDASPAGADHTTHLAGLGSGFNFGRCLCGLL